jgi:predicted PurR-regulated permease PerM
MIPVPREPSRAQWITFGILLTVSIVLVIAVFRTVWKPIFLAAVLAGAFSSWHERVALRLKQKRGLTSVLFTVGVVFLFLIPLSIIVVIAVSETISAINFVQESLAAGGARELVRRLPAAIQDDVRVALDFLGTRASTLSTELAAGGAFAVTFVRNALSTTGGLFFDGLLMLIALKFMLSDGYRLIAWIQNASPMRGLHTAELLNEFHRTSKSALGSMTITAATQGFVAAIGYTIAGVPQPFFFGLLTFFTSFIPAVGTGLVAIPLAVLLLLLGKTVAGIFLAAYAFLVIGMVDNLLKPLLMKGGMRLHGAIVFFALIGGVWLFGPVGLIAGPLTVTFFVSMVRLGQRDFRGLTHI